MTILLNHMADGFTSCEIILPTPVEHFTHLLSFYSVQQVVSAGTASPFLRYLSVRAFHYQGDIQK